VNLQRLWSIPSSYENLEKVSAQYPRRGDTEGDAQLNAVEMVARIRSDLKERETEEGKRKSRRFFKEEISCYGLTMSQINEVAGKHYPLLKGDLNSTLAVSEMLIRSGVMEEGAVAVYLLRKAERRLTPKHFETLDMWIDYLTNWANTDEFSAHVVGELLMRDLAKIGRLLEWTRSENRWRRRAAAVSLVLPARRGLYLDQILAVAERLMTDGDEMVQKGVGWLLKEASRKHPQEIRQFLLAWREKTAALVLRYASEKLPSDMRVLKSR
jgi:3-methyladenine DNA glycosylase AlkD